MFRSQHPFRIMALCTAMAAAMIVPPHVTAQNGDTADSDSKVGTRVQKTRDVDWEAMRREEAQRGRLSLQSGDLLEAPPMVASVPREELNKARLPILLPDDGRMVERMRLFTKPNYYMASLRDDEHSIQITGTRISQGELRAKGAPERIKSLSQAQGYLYQSSEYGCEVSFTRYNVSYNIAIECSEPDSDPRCTGKEYVVQLMRSLVYVGGMPEDDGSQ